MPRPLLYVLAFLRQQFDLSPQREDEDSLRQKIESGVDFRGTNSWVLIFAIFVASLGLNVNSPAVIIGAMLISPLMGPIIGMGLALGINDIQLLRKSLRNLVIATVISVLTAMIYFLITPLDEAQSELLARTSPTIYDVLIAFFGGAAGIVALSNRGGGGNVIPGVAIATALMPPLCTAGYGLAVGELSFFVGAFSLFFINTVFICLATSLGVRLLKFTPILILDATNTKRKKHFVIGFLLLALIPAAYFTFDIVRNSFLERNMRHFLQNELSQSGTHFLSNKIDRATQTLEVVVLGQEITPQHQQAAENRLADYHLEGYHLQLIQGASSDSLMDHRAISTDGTSSNSRRVQELQVQVSSLEARLQPYQRNEQLAAALTKESKVLFPVVRSIALQTLVLHEANNLPPKKLLTAVITQQADKQLSSPDQSRLRQWIQERAHADTLLFLLR